MRRMTFALFAALLMMAARSPEERVVTDPASIASATNAAARPVPIDDLYFTRGVQSPAWSPDGGSIAFVTNLTGRYNLWRVASAGGWPIQLALSDDRQTAPAWSPDGKTILWQEDRGGNEYSDLFAAPANGGAAVNLTGTPSLSETNALYSPDGRMVAIELKSKTAAFSDVALFDPATKSVRNLTNEKASDRSWSLRAWTPDGKALIADRTNPDDTDSDIYRIDLSTGAVENLTAHAKAVNFSAADISPDGKTLLINSNEKAGYPNVALLDLATKKRTWVTELQWEATAGDFSPNGKWLTYLVNEDGRQDIYLAAANGSNARKLPLPEGINATAGRPSAFSPKGDRLLVAHQSSTQPADFWTFDLASGRATQLTHSAIASLDAAALPPSQIVHYKSFDGTMISALLWMPFNLERNGKNPGIVLPHGGPTGQTTDTFNRTVVTLASRGYTVIAPNVRGSTGYGLAFQQMNVKDLGGGDLQDEVFAAKLLVATGYIDPKKVGITGGSYGGFMTLMAIGKTPDVWAAAVSAYGIVDWLTMLQHEDPSLQEYEKTLLGDPVKDRAIYENTSPIKHLRNAAAPLLVLQGENDIRVPKEEAEQVVKILKDAGKTVDAHFYPAEGHGFQKRENQIDAARRLLAWFEKYLK
jgi:dipeptidyl aminopeptidase/acylaminoacyl peptidase